MYPREISNRPPSAGTSYQTPTYTLRNGNRYMNSLDYWLIGWRDK